MTRRRWVFAGLFSLLGIGVAAAAEPRPAQFNTSANNDLIRLADIQRAFAALNQLPPEGRAAARASLENESKLLVQRIRDEAHRFAVTFHVSPSDFRSLESRSIWSALPSSSHLLITLAVYVSNVPG